MPQHSTKFHIIHGNVWHFNSNWEWMGLNWFIMIILFDSAVSYLDQLLFFNGWCSEFFKFSKHCSICLMCMLIGSATWQLVFCVWMWNISVGCIVVTRTEEDWSYRENIWENWAETEVRKTWWSGTWSHSRCLLYIILTLFTVVVELTRCS